MASLVVPLPDPSGASDREGTARRKYWHGWTSGVGIGQGLVTYRQGQASGGREWRVGGDEDGQGFHLEATRRRC